MTHQDAFQFLTEAQLRKMACSIYTENNADRVLKNYREVRTPNVIRDLSLYGWKPVRAYQVKPKLQTNKGYQKHFVHFRNEEIFIGPRRNIELIPEIILTNSYDARASFKLYVCMHKPANSSGLIIGNNEKIAHREVDPESKNNKGGDVKYKTNEVEKLIRKMVYNNLPESIKIVQRFKKIQLDRTQARRLAELLCKDRWDYKYQLASPERLTKPGEEEDIKDSSAWTMFCRIHERILRGGWVGPADRTIKPLKDPNREMKVNIKMFDTISHFVSTLK